MHRTAARRKQRRLSPLPPPRLLAVAVAFASTLTFLLLVLLSTPPSLAAPARPPRQESILLRGAGASPLRRHSEPRGARRGDGVDAPHGPPLHRLRAVAGLVPPRPQAAGPPQRQRRRRRRRQHLRRPLPRARLLGGASAPARRGRAAARSRRSGAAPGVRVRAEDPSLSGRARGGRRQWRALRVRRRRQGGDRGACHRRRPHGRRVRALFRCGIWQLIETRESSSDTVLEFCVSFRVLELNLRDNA
ncbi:hypothetical protein HU200_025284 [Digitaria exilis]|uniref:Uncharacterized protein n=1 Tax=Digitaria exilis TaxID=1010633 RepID=A0A835BXB1_9POAL|nr:hypothetical protein HU200_025284 [Digitaria exilis]